MIFPSLELESLVQVDDKTRLSAKKTFVSKGDTAPTTVEVEPEAGSGFIDVFGTSYKDWYLDWSYATDGDKVVSVRVSNGIDTETITKTITVISAADDALFSNDQDLTAKESEILNWVPDGRNSFLNVHRKAQTYILKWLNDQGYTAFDGTPIVKSMVISLDQIREWSAVLTLKLIYEDLKNSSGDHFEDKATVYKDYELEFRSIDKLKLDFNLDGEQGDFEFQSLVVRDLVRG